MTACPDWARATLALTLLAVDPGGLGGICLRARPGPVRQRLETALSALPLPLRRIHPGISDGQLFGGLNVAASLAQGRMVRDAGLAETSAALILPMAERTPPGLAARLAQILDARGGHALVLLDEGAEPQEAAPATLTERLAFLSHLDGVAQGAATVRLPAPGDLDAARARLLRVRVPEDQAAALVALAARFGIASLRAPLLARRAAAAQAALEGRSETTGEDIRTAAELVFPARATQVPEPPEQPAETPDNAPDPDAGGAQAEPADLSGDMLVAAVAALLPPDLLARLDARARAAAGARGSGAGARHRGNRRGRPLPPRPGRPDGRARIDVAATLRAAAPWQPLRRRGSHRDTGIIVHPSDLRLKRFEDRSDRLVIFVVDASGSAAVARMAEAKGAVELMLGQAYARRDQVALVAFRGQGAEVLLPPTRSLVQAKRRLAGLPGGGGTPLAAGLRAALGVAESGALHGLSPALALLTDGRANVALDGTSGRAPAQEDARGIARHLAARGIPSVVIDTAARPGPESAALAGWIGARYLALPRANAGRLAAATGAALNG